MQNTAYARFCTGRCQTWCAKGRPCLNGYYAKGAEKQPILTDRLLESRWEVFSDKVSHREHTVDQDVDSTPRLLDTVRWLEEPNYTDVSYSYQRRQRKNAAGHSLGDSRVSRKQLSRSHTGAKLVPPGADPQGHIVEGAIGR